MDDRRWPVGVAYGTRMEAFRLGPLVRALHVSELLRPVVVVAPREPLGDVNDIFGVSPDADLGGLPAEHSPASATADALGRYAEYLDRSPLAAMVVHGGTATAFAASLAAFHTRVPVVHAEAGARTAPQPAPDPADAFSRLVTRLASLHLAPSRHSRDVLLAEGVQPVEIVVTGSTLVEALAHITRAPGSIGEGRAADRGRAAIEYLFGGGDRPADSAPVDEPGVSLAS